MSAGVGSAVPQPASAPVPTPPPVMRPSERPTRFVRLFEANGRDQRAFETAVVRYEKPDADTTVDLIAVIHIGDASYYRELNQLFPQYDAVLYELVAAGDDPKPERSDSDGNPLRAMQVALTDILHLQFQLDWIDYSKPNMVHADMSPEQLFAAMAAGGETVLGLLSRILQEAPSSTGASDLDLVAALLAQDDVRAMRLKRMMARELHNARDLILALDGDGGSAIVSRRNEVVMKRLHQKLGAGAEHVAIFYGAGHMPDLEKRLRRELDLRRGPTRWLAAWDLATRSDGGSRAREQ